MSIKLLLTLSAALFTSSAGIVSLTEKQPDHVEAECERLVSFGKASLCLPPIVGMAECYRDPVVKEIFDATNYSKNTFLGCYLQKDDLESLELTGFAEMNQFIRIYAMTDLVDVSMTNSDLAKFIDVIKSNYVRENWSRLREEIESEFQNWEFDRPVMLDEYRLNDSAYTFVVLTRSNDVVTSESMVQLQFMNTAIVDNRLIWFTYHQKFEGIESAEIARAQNDFVALQFLASNR